MLCPLIFAILFTGAVIVALSWNEIRVKKPTDWGNFNW